MLQCPSCRSFHDDDAAFCSHCGARTQAVSPGARPRGLRLGVRVGTLLVLVAAMVTVLLVVLSPEPGKEPVSRAPAGPRTERPRAPEARPAAASGSPQRPEVFQAVKEEEEAEPLDSKKASAIVRRALVSLDLRGENGRQLGEEPGVIVDATGVVLTRYRPLLGAHQGTCLLPGAEQPRVEVTGLIYRDENLDLALVRIARSPVGYPMVPLLPEAASQQPQVGDPLFLFVWDQVVTSSVSDLYHVASDGIARLEAAEAPLPPHNSFLAVDSWGYVVGLCRTEAAEGLLQVGTQPSDREYRILVDRTAPLARSTASDSVITLLALTRGYFEGTFADLLERGVLASRQSRWNDAIEVLEQAIDRIGVDRPSEEDAALANETLRTSYVEEVHRLMEAERHPEAAVVAQAAGRRFPEEAVFLVRLGEIRYAQGEWAAGIEALGRARQLWTSSELDGLLEVGYLRLASQADQAQDTRAEQETLLEGLRELPESGRLHLELGRLYTRFAAYGDAVVLLNRAKELSSDLRDEADALLARIDDILKNRDAVVIPFDADHRSIRTTARLDGVRDLSLIIDTGATYTTLPLHVVQEMGYGDVLAKAPLISVNTAAGPIAARRIQIQSLDIGGYAVRPLEVLVIPQTGSEEYGLLGLNFLKHFKYTVDASRGEFRIERP